MRHALRLVVGLDCSLLDDGRRDKHGGRRRGDVAVEAREALEHGGDLAPYGI